MMGAEIVARKLLMILELLFPGTGTGMECLGDLGGVWGQMRLLERYGNRVLDGRIG